MRNKRNLQNSLNQIEAQADAALANYDPDASYDPSDYDPSFDMDAVSRHLGSAGVAQAGQIKRKLQKLSQMVDHQKGVAGNYGRGADPRRVLTGEEAQFDIVATRDTAVEAFAFPYAMFGVQDLDNDYTAVLAALIPAGVTLVVTRTATSIDFAYTGGVGTDTISVTCPQYPYPSLVRSTIADVLDITKMRYSLSDATVVGQFSNPLNQINRNLFGKTLSNNLPVTANKTPDQFQDGIIDIDQGVTIDKETSVVNSINSVAAFAVTLSMFVPAWVRLNKETL